MILTRHDGQELLDALSALSLGASALVIAQWGLASTLRSRLGFIFGGLCAFFATRAAIGAFDSQTLVLVNQSIACAMPLAALLLVEGALRRHAPKPLKAFVVFGALAVAVALFVPASRNVATNYGLGVFVIASLVCTTGLLVARDRASLSRQENAGLDALAVPGILLTLMTVTDFLPASPIGLSGVGCAMLAFVLAANPSSRRETRGVLADLFGIACVAIVSEPAFAATLGHAAPEAQVRMGSVLIAMLLATAAVLRVRPAREERTALSFGRALTLADTSNVDSYLSSLADQPLLGDMRLAEGRQLAEYDGPGLGVALGARTVWTKANLRDDTVPTRAREELGDLMARSDATHAVLVSREPLRIALFILPGGGQAGYVETDLALFGKLATSAAAARA